MRVCANTKRPRERFSDLWRNLTNCEHKVFLPQMVKINEGLVAADLLRFLWLAKKKQWWLNVLMVGLLWGHPLPSCLCYFLFSLFPGCVERWSNDWTATVLALLASISFCLFKYVLHCKASATTSQEYLIPLFLQALDFFTTKTNSSTKATSPSTDQWIQHSFPLEHCYCTRTLNIGFGSDLIGFILCLCSVEDYANQWKWCHKLKISVLTIFPHLRWTKQPALVTLGIVEVTKRFDQLSMMQQ